MIIVLKANTPKEEAKQLIDHIKSKGLQVDISKGARQTVMGLVGNTDVIDVEQIPAAKFHALAVVGRDVALLAVLCMYEARARPFKQLPVKKGLVKLRTRYGVLSCVCDVCHVVLFSFSVVLLFPMLSGKSSAV